METARTGLLTIGEVARRLNVPVHRIQYILRTRQHLSQSARAGIIRCFDEQAIAAIQTELTLIASRRLEGRAP